MFFGMGHTLLFFFFFSFLAAPQHTESSPARDQIQAVVAIYVAAVAMLDPLIRCAWLGIEPASWCCRDTADPVAPQWELLYCLFNVKNFKYRKAQRKINMYYFHNLKKIY